MLLLNGDRLSTYLNDHLAGATAGLDLARRIARDNEGNGYGAEMAEIAGEIAADRDTLQEVMDRLERLGELRTQAAAETFGRT